MSFVEYLKAQQPLIYQTFINARKNNVLSHAYLIKGDQSTPTLETALYLAKSLICESGNYFACEHCPSCIRFDKGNYADFILLNAQKENLKVADIDNLTKRFSETSLEKKGISIYIIHHVENMNRESVNALLKFLEEPSTNIFAFLTTENESKVLPTILSRCQHLKLLPDKKNIVIENVLKKGVDKLDGELLINFASEENALINLANDDSYKLVKNIFLGYIKSLNDSLLDGYYYLQTEAVGIIKTKEQIRLFIDLLANFFKEMLYIDLNIKKTDYSLNDYLENIAKSIKNKEECYKQIMFIRGQIELNVTIALILEHIGYIIYQGGKK